MIISASSFYDVENIYYEEDEWFDDHVDNSVNWNELYYSYY